MAFMMAASTMMFLWIIVMWMWIIMTMFFGVANEFMVTKELFRSIIVTMSEESTMAE